MRKRVPNTTPMTIPAMAPPLRLEPLSPELFLLERETAVGVVVWTTEVVVTIIVVGASFEAETTDLVTIRVVYSIEVMTDVFALLAEDDSLSLLEEDELDEVAVELELDELEDELELDELELELELDLELDEEDVELVVE